MNPKIFMVLGAFSGFISVAMGAFGAHILKHRLSPEMLEVFDTAVRYQIFHSLALMAVSWAMAHDTHSLIPSAGWLFIAGILIFSGSLYILAFSGVKIWGAVTPFGGMMLLLGWLALAFGSWMS